jgi:hypothetical protein
MKAKQNVYDIYWKTAAERQEIFFKKLKALPPPHTSDPIYQTYKFCNVYRASDRVSQFLIKKVIYGSKFTPEDTLFRIFLFRLLNKIETWQMLEKKLGEITLKDFSFGKYSDILEEIRKSQSIYGNAFILCANKAFGYDKKHQNHLALIESIFKKQKIVDQLLFSRKLKSLFESLKDLPLIGNFMAYQLAIDFNYSEVFNFDENDFTVAGPGAVRGIKKCFLDTDGKSNEYIIQYMVNNQDREFERLGIRFKDLWGRPMHAIDCQGWFCETDKYSRVKFPNLKSNRVKIKTKYNPKAEQITSIPRSGILIKNSYLIRLSNMGKKINKFIYWTPRILGILLILFLMMFSLDVFDLNLNSWQIIVGLFMHNLPALFLLIILIISWKHEIVGGIVFILAGLAYIILAESGSELIWYETLLWSLIIAGPALLIGILFLINWLKKGKHHKGAA